MRFNEFIEAITTVLKERNPDRVVRSVKCGKNNGLVLTGIVMMNKNEIVAPTVYVDGYYEDLISEQITIEEIAKEIEEICNKNKFDYEGDIIRDIRDFEKSKDRIVYILVNTELNKEFLKDKPHREFLNLSIVYKIDFETDDDSIATINVTNQIMKIWGVTEEDLYTLAERNTPKLRGLVIKNVVNLLNYFANFEDSDIYKAALECLRPKVGMYIVTNNKRCYGASIMIYKDLLKEIHNRFERDYIIIPSSVNEILIICTEENEIIDRTINDMVKEVNQVNLELEDILSNNAYYYNGEELSVIK